MNRRQLFSAAPLAAIVSAFPAIASAGADTPISILFAEWKRLIALASNEKLPEADFQILYENCREIETKLIILPSENAADLARKIFAFTNDGDHTLDGPNAEPIWKELRSLAL